MFILMPPRHHSVKPELIINLTSLKAEEGQIRFQPFWLEEDRLSPWNRLGTEVLLPWCLPLCIVIFNKVQSFYPHGVAC